MLRHRARREKRARERESRTAARAVPLHHTRGWFRPAFDGCAQGWAAAPPGDDLAALLPQNTLQPLALQLHKCPRVGPAGFLPSNELAWWPMHACCGSHAAMIVTTSAVCNVHLPPPALAQWPKGRVYHGLSELCPVQFVTTEKGCRLEGATGSYAAMSLSNGVPGSPDC